MSILRLAGVSREVGTFKILDSIDAAIALGDRIGLVGPNGAGKTTLLRLAAGQDEPDRGTVHRKRGLSIGLLAQEAHFDAAFMAAPDLRTAVRTGASHLETMATELAALEAAGRVTEPAYADLQHQFDVLGGYTLDQRVDARSRGSASPVPSGPSRRPRCRAANRPAPRWPASSSPTRTCSSSTSRPTISTWTPSSGSRSTSAVGPARSWSPPTTGRSSTRR
jgi:energy-coupling factor transporter ATP-binding protein EcfA2